MTGPTDSTGTTAGRPRPLTVLVTGATGAQGGAVARALHSRRHAVRCLTRDPTSTAAAALRAAGMAVCRGDFEDPESVRRAAAGADAAFVMSTPGERGPTGETAQATQVLDAAVAAGVPHLVYSSAANADRCTGIAWYDSKYRVEQHLWRLPVRATVLAPAVFMRVVLTDQLLAGLRQGVLRMALPAGYRQTWIDLADLGELAAILIERPPVADRARIDVASQRLACGKAAELIGAAAGRPIRYEQLPVSAVRAFNPAVAQMYDWFLEVGLKVDLPALHTAHPQVSWGSFGRWAAGQDWSRLLDGSGAHSTTR